MNLSTLLRQSHRTIFSWSRFALESGQRPQKANLPVLLEISKRWKADDRRELIKSTPLRDQGTHGEKLLDVDLIGSSQESMFPDAETKDRLFEGIKFSDLPICYIKASKNNTIMNITDGKGQNRIAYRSCGMDGFKNCRKGTNIAAQTTAIAIGTEAKGKGTSQVRVMVQGLGPGRMSAVKGLQMAGLKVISVTDNTPISFNPPRPRKARRL